MLGEFKKQNKTCFLNEEVHVRQVAKDPLA